MDNLSISVREIQNQHVGDGMQTQNMYWLVLTITATAVMWIPYILNSFLVRGILGTMGNPSASSPALSIWAQRAKLAHLNAIENLAIFAPLAILCGLRGGEIQTVSCVYFYSRLGHYLVYTAGMPVIRTVLFLVGFVCQMILVVTLLGGGL